MNDWVSHEITVTRLWDLILISPGSQTVISQWVSHELRLPESVTPCCDTRVSFILWTKCSLKNLLSTSYSVLSTWILVVPTLGRRVWSDSGVNPWQISCDFSEYPRVGSWSRGTSERRYPGLCPLIRWSEIKIYIRYVVRQTSVFNQSHFYLPFRPLHTPYSIFIWTVSAFRSDFFGPKFLYYFTLCFREHFANVTAMTSTQNHTQIATLWLTNNICVPAWTQFTQNLGLRAETCELVLCLNFSRALFRGVFARPPSPFSHPTFSSNFSPANQRSPGVSWTYTETLRVVPEAITRHVPLVACAQSTVS